MNQSLSMPASQCLRLAISVHGFDVYPPKPASYLLADTVTRLIPPGSRVLDLCTGTGVVGLAIAHSVPGSVVVATDINPDAVECARQNAIANGIDNFTVVEADLYGPHSVVDFDWVVAHPPAVPYPVDGDWGMSPGMRLATNGGLDGTDVFRRIISGFNENSSGTILALLVPGWCRRSAIFEQCNRMQQNNLVAARKCVEFFPWTPAADAKAKHWLRRLGDCGDVDVDTAAETPFSEAQVWVSTGFASKKAGVG